MIIAEDKIATRWKEYVEDLYEGQLDDDILENDTDVEQDDLGPYILREEFDTALKGLKLRKAPGVDSIQGEILQTLGDKAKTALYQLVNDMYTTGELPEDFEKTVLVPIPKSKHAQKCQDYRTISLTTHASKILTRIIYHRLEKRIEENLSEDQFGFRRNRGTREAILSLRTIIEKALRINKNIIIAFIDIEKAFDNVNWNIMLKTLKRLKVDYRDRKIIYQLYKNQTALIGKEQMTAKIGKGVRQGCSLSPLLFNIYVEEAMKEFSAKCTHGIKINGELYQTIRFADDIALIAESEETLEIALQELNDHLRVKCNMKINKTKTKIMKCSRDGSQKNSIWLEGERLAQVNLFKYLGSIITSDGRCEKDIRSRIAQAKEAFNKKRSLLTSKAKSLPVRKRFIKSYIWSIATYGCETWTLLKADKKRLCAFEMWCWRRMLYGYPAHIG